MHIPFLLGSMVMHNSSYWFQNDALQNNMNISFKQKAFRNDFLIRTLLLAWIHIGSYVQLHARTHASTHARTHARPYTHLHT